MLSISKLSKTYANGVRALDDVTLHIGHGLFGLLGPNGAGKSTLMSVSHSATSGESGVEPPLSRAGNQAYLYYRKGAIVMYALKNLLGEDAVNTALRNLLREQGGPGRKPSTADLLDDCARSRRLSIMPSSTNG